MANRTNTPDIGFYIKRINDLLEKRANNALRSSGLTLMQMAFLMTLQDAPEGQRTMKELEGHFGVAQSTVAGIVSRLEHKNLVESTRDSSDKRIKRVHITQKGETCCEESKGHRKDVESVLLEGFSQEEKKQFAALLEKAEENLA